MCVLIYELAYSLQPLTSCLRTHEWHQSHVTPDIRTIPFKSIIHFVVLFIDHKKIHSLRGCNAPICQAGHAYGTLLPCTHQMQVTIIQPVLQLQAPQGSLWHFQGPINQLRGSPGGGWNQAREMALFVGRQRRSREGGGCVSFWAM